MRWIPRAWRGYALIAGVLAVMITGAARAQSCPATWSDAFASGDLSNIPRAMVVWNGDLYMGGQFTYAGGAHANYVAKWDGRKWTQVGAGFTSYVYSLCVFNNELYAGGQFGASGANNNVRYVARWDGSAWVPVGNGFNNAVLSLAVFNGELYATGYFTGTFTGGTTVNYFAKLSGSTWQPVGTGLSGVGETLCVLNNQLYVGGQFLTADGVTVNRVARLNGNTFAPVGAGFANNEVTCLGTYNGSLYAGGSFTQSGTVSLNRLARWTGSAWADVGAGVNSSVYTLREYDDGSGNALYVGGQFSVAGVDPMHYLVRWNGVEWVQIADLNGQVYAMCPYNDGGGTKLILGGAFSSLGAAPNSPPVYATYMAEWNGTYASDLGHGVNGTTYAFTQHNGDLYIGGSFSRADGAVVDRVAHFTGASMERVGSYDFIGDVRALTSFGGQLWAGGDFYFSAGNGFRYVARFDGTSWVPAGNGLNSSVYNFTTFNNQLYAGGAFSANGTNAITVPRVGVWTGTDWAPVGDGFNSYVYDMAVYNNELYACGLFTNNYNSNAAQPALRIARYNAATQTWVRIAQGLNNTADCLAVYNGEIYVGGTFTTAGLTSANRIARWSAAAGWQDVGGGADGEVYDLFTHNDGSGEALYAVGAFNNIGGIAASRIAKWNGTGWCQVGSGADQSISAQPRVGYSYQGNGARTLVIGGSFVGLDNTSGNNMIRIVGCTADIDDGSGTGNPDGAVTIDDLLYYLVIFEAGTTAADVDNGSGTGTPDGAVTIEDLLYYLLRYEAGC